MENNKKLAMYAFVVLILIIVVWQVVVIPLIPKSLEIENIDPKNSALNITENTQTDLHFDIKSNVNKTWVNSIIKQNIVHNSKNYLQVSDFTYPDPITGKGGTSKLFLPMTFTAINSEGSLLKYTVYLGLSANGSENILDNKTITVTIKPNSYEVLPQNTNYPQNIKFDKFSTTSLQVKEGSAPTSVTFDIVSTQDGKFSNIKIASHIIHSSGRYLLGQEKSYGNMTGNGQRIGSQTFSFSAISSEGDEIDYPVYLDLYANGQIMDSKLVNVTILPK